MKIKHCWDDFLIVRTSPAHAQSQQISTSASVHAGGPTHALHGMHRRTSETSSSPNVSICQHENKTDLLQRLRPAGRAVTQQMFYDITQLVIARPYGIAMDDAAC